MLFHLDILCTTLIGMEGDPSNKVSFCIIHFVRQSVLLRVKYILNQCSQGAYFDLRLLNKAEKHKDINALR